jgi:hypothetical protein
MLHKLCLVAISSFFLVQLNIIVCYFIEGSAEQTAKEEGGECVAGHWRKLRNEVLQCL